MGLTIDRLDPTLKALVLGSLLGDIYFLNGDAGDDHANAQDFDHAMKTLRAAVMRASTGNHDYILCFGAETGTAAVAIAQADLHIIGIGNGGPGNVIGRGFQYTCPATVDTLQPAATADGLELAGIQFTCHATDHILMDDAGADRLYIHHNTIMGSTTLSVAVRFDLEGAYPVLEENHFYLCKLPIDLIGAYSVARKNYFQDVSTTAIGINIATGDYGIVDGNIFNLSGGTGDTGVKIAAGANYWTVSNNDFNASLSDAISDGGTGTLKINNRSASILGATGASIQLAISD